MSVNVKLAVAALVALPWAQGTVQAQLWTTEISNSNPLHWFRFNELSGSVADDQGSANMDGTYVGGVVLGNPALAGQAAAFDAGAHVLLGGANLATDWSVEALFKADTVNGGVSMGLIGTDWTAASDRMAIKAEQFSSSGQMGYTVFGVADVTFAGSAAATPSDFAHVVFVGQTTGVSLYVNGAPAGSSATSTPLARWALAAGSILADGTVTDPLTGMIDELVIYDRALSPTEIAAHFSAVPEPSSALACALLLLGGAGAIRIIRRR